MQTNVQGGHFLTEDIALFDASFFNFSAELAAVRNMKNALIPCPDRKQSLDPQFRLQLETTFEAMESGMFEPKVTALLH